MATPSLTRHTLPGAFGPLLVDVRTSDRGSTRPAVLVVHGFKGFKDWGMFPLLAERIARAGFIAVSFNLSGCGVDDAGQFSFPDRFGHNTYSGELEDIEAMIDALAAGRLGVAPTERVGLVGHSRGGGMAILTASRDARVQALVTWAAIARVHRWEGQEAEWRRAGRLEVLNTRTGQVLPLYPDVLEDLDANRAVLDIQAAAGRLTIPWLLVHGESDTSVPASEADELARAAPVTNPPRRLAVAGAGHTFGAVHPFAGMTPDLALVLDETVKWMGRYL